MKPKTAIAIISGYLGAGKTTLLLRIISRLDRKFAVLMNEFGEIGIDTQVVQGKNIDVIELLGGCVCCSLTGEFEEAVREIVEKYNPELILVETTGVAEPDGLVLDIQDNLPEVRLDVVATVADADALLRFPQVGRTEAVQLEMADVIVLNKIDLIDKGDVEKAKAKIKKYNRRAPILEASYGEVDIDILFGVEVEHHSKGIHHKHRTAFESFACAVKKTLKREKLEQFLHELPKEVYRLKGFVALDDGKTYLLNYVAGRWEFEEKRAKELSLVFIGENINQFKEQIERKLAVLQKTG